LIYFRPDDIVQSLNQWIPSITTNFDLFPSKLKYDNEYLPFGEQLLNYQLNGEPSFSYPGRALRTP
jgi:hypothetical protein